MANTSKVNPTPPTPSSANQDVPNRGSVYGEQFVYPIGHGRVHLADEGSYFVATNPTPGTGIATIAALSAFAATSPFFMLVNTSTTKKVYLDFIQLGVTVVGTSAASLSHLLVIDNGIGRYTSGGSSLTPKNVNMLSDTVSLCSVYCGALVAGAASGLVRQLGGGSFRPAAPQVGDSYTVTFGCPESNFGQIVTDAIIRVVVNHSPVVVGPQQTFLYYIWLASQSAASNFEIEAGWWER